jgi:hypothetical protein
MAKPQRYNDELLDEKARKLTMALMEKAEKMLAVTEPTGKIDWPALESIGHLLDGVSNSVKEEEGVDYDD